ncbi:enoyl-CoA hydratase/isomerase family protein [Sphingobacterium psychroaquaticum]|uniref:Enoyl-CoA hydratase/carnithine racemase n=1 Tax=Sphingobacterium psychroaquaticum TaxID=561061 RepID=A0A1X7KAM6_9SPHI|nr:enoyl-CoA hydratase/isomerase family protein [Sphingobacterium psychroaquaticum]SMG38225.1 Enoyl-CoA hydratase/carnithine racemase [Sphingobacterium psychroaquaticum]
MTYNYIKTDITNFVFTLTLARPEKRNAFTPTMVNEIRHALVSANYDDRVKLVLINAEGPVFCAGMDLKTFNDPSLDIQNPHIVNKEISLGEVMEQLNKPSVAILEGDVIAGAFLLIANCTYVFAAEKVRFRLPELSIGLFPFQVMAGLLKVMPEKMMLQLCLNTDYFDREKAKEYGLVDRNLEDVDFLTFVDRFNTVETKALVAGLSAAKELPMITPDKRYNYLLEKLAALRDIEK